MALVVRRPDLVRTLVAHEPPVAQLLPDRGYVLAACRDIHDECARSGLGPAMAKFIALAGHKGPVLADHADRPAPDPTMFGLPMDDDGSRTDPLVGQNIVSCTHYAPISTRSGQPRPASSSRSGAESSGEMANRSGVALAERLGTTPVTFPGDHGGFLGGEYGMTGDPGSFAVTLREVLPAT
jgi:hypothetical protein